MIRRRVFGLCVVAACSSEDPGRSGLDPTPAWRVVFEDQPGGLLRVAGTSARDVYVAGADSTLLHFDGDRWRRIVLPVDAKGDLWWFETVGPDDVRVVGSAGTVWRYRPSTGAVTRSSAPSGAVLFGVWGAAPEDVWYVGGEVALNRGVIWRDDGQSIRAPVPGVTATSSATIFKVYGWGPDAIWMVGQGGNTAFWDGTQFHERAAPIALPLFAVHGKRPERVFAVGGSAGGVLLAWNGTEWIDETPAGAPSMNGIWATGDEEAIAVGFNGRSYRRTAAGWTESSRLPTFLDLHAVWVDPEGGIWAAGGQLSANPPTHGVLLHYGPEIPREIE